MADISIFNDREFQVGLQDGLAARVRGFKPRINPRLRRLARMKGPRAAEAMRQLSIRAYAKPMLAPVFSDGFAARGRGPRFPRLMRVAGVPRVRGSNQAAHEANRQLKLKHRAEQRALRPAKLKRLRGFARVLGPAAVMTPTIGEDPTLEAKFFKKLKAQAKGIKGKLRALKRSATSTFKVTRGVLGFKKGLTAKQLKRASTVRKGALVVAGGAALALTGGAALGLIGKGAALAGKAGGALGLLKKAQGFIPGAGGTAPADESTGGGSEIPPAEPSYLPAPAEPATAESPDVGGSGVMTGSVGYTPSAGSYTPQAETQSAVYEGGPTQEAPGIPKAVIVGGLALAGVGLYLYTRRRSRG